MARGIAPVKSNYPNTITPETTWTDLVGPFQAGDELDGRMWVRPTGPSRYKVLWIFETPELALDCFRQWLRGY